MLEHIHGTLWLLLASIVNAVVLTSNPLNAELNPICHLLALFFFFQALNFLFESSGLLNDLFPLPSFLDAGYPVFDLQLANVLVDVILPSVLGSSL